MRWKLLAPSSLPAAMTVRTALFASPYAPAGGPRREIGKQQAIEDERQGSEMPLVARLEMGGMPLAYIAGGAGCASRRVRAA